LSHMLQRFTSFIHHSLLFSPGCKLVLFSHLFSIRAEV
jgi:hypothetical protein